MSHFVEDPPPRAQERDHGADAPATAFILDLEGFEGPIDLLLSLAREQKVDISRMSILRLADQYLALIAEARRVRLELAADWLVMAAWLAYLKSRLLLPEPDTEEPSGEELAAALTFQLQRLEAMQQVGAKLIGRPRLGRDVFPRGAPEGVDVTHKPAYEVTLYDLLKAYGEHKRRQQSSTFHLTPSELYAVDEALKRLSALLGRMTQWAELARFLPDEAFSGTLFGRSAVAAHFLASLELAKTGAVDIRQEKRFAPIYLRRREPESGGMGPDREGRQE